jgi:hypothetical protein
MTVTPPETQTVPLPPVAILLEEFYYIQHKGYVGNCLQWWKVNRCGYTCDLLKAWKVRKTKAEEICAVRPDEDIPWPASKAEHLVQWHLLGRGAE